MKIKKLILKNIRSYENQEIVFPDGTLLLSGDIGSGKTSILLALEYALFGIQPGQRGAALLRNKSDSGEVILHLDIKDEEVIIERRLRRNETSVTNEYSAITINGEKSEMAVSELKTRVIQLLGYPAEFIKKNNVLYRYTVYTPQEQMKQIITEDPEVRLNVLRHIFGVDKYKHVKENLVILMQHLKEETKMLKNEVALIEQEKEKIKQSDILLAELEKRIFEKIRVIDEKKSQRAEAENNIKSLEEKRNEREVFLREVAKTELLILTKRENYLSVAKGLKEVTEILSSQKEVFSKDELDSTINELNSLQSDMNSIQQELMSLKSSQKAIEQRAEENKQRRDRIFKIDICPTCLQNVSDLYKHNIINEIEKQEVELKKQKENTLIKENQIEEMLKNKKKAFDAFDKRRFEIEVLKTKQAETERALKQQQAFEQQKKALESDIEFLEKHLTGTKENLLAFSTFESMWNKNQLLLKEALYQEKKEEIDLARLQKEKEIIQKDKENLYKSIKEREFIKKKMIETEELSHWLLGNFTNLISFTEQQILLKLRHEFSKLFKKWFNILAGEEFETHLDETFTPIISQGDIEMEYPFLSGGERTAVALAYRLALNQTINSVLSTILTRGIIILDEPTEGFSSSQIEKIRDILEELDIPQLIIVSHETQIEGFVDHVIKLKKENNCSIVETTLQ